MKSAVLAATIFALGVAAQGAEPQINTPTSLVQCQPIKITWTGGKPPYWVSALPGGEPGGVPLKDWGQQTGTELTWTVDLPAGTSISMQVKDSNGAINYAQAVSVRAGSDTKCLDGASSGTGAGAGAAAGSGAASPAASSPAAASGSPAAASSPAAAGSSAGAAAASSGSARPASASVAASGSAAAAASPSGTSSAGRIAASTGLVGAAALFLAAFL
ncbi:uncharacterized protein COLE_00963 [Cutaneotrichosporon oleaginosum]|uniref:uncharacterized protein n=1 Tax=Cutaneotrichosporon oleaginosum TaxID=879819 RepID=UPI00132A3CF0|nr:hypothetical protein COLE_00963 [Cutaneotrichosporon oleaginosum]